MGVERQDHEEPPPLFSSWNTWYTVVFLNLVFLIVLFSIFTLAFR
jgi:hypothetical protein